MGAEVGAGSDFGISSTNLASGEDEARKSGGRSSG